MTAALRNPDLLDKQDWTTDDLASLPEGLRYELIDGRLILPSPTSFHQLLGVELVLMLRPNCPLGYVPVPDLSLDVDRRNEPRPDVVVVDDRYMLRSPVPVDGALLVVEVISPTSHFRDMHAKTEIYAAAGVGSYWVVDPTFDGSVVLTVFRPGDDGKYERVISTTKVFSTDVPYEITIDLPALTALRDKYLAAQDDA
ncbi:Uma2 family endonuclease [Actinoplanes hulinensis]|uniref:Uma2 family endonuclease n=1 Tax=Actinoplanes hulinensis TaxID=1144547 RepID=A0ABS7BAI1_9ACTN|nr:Uma2 family endonuclease [Actinoplanes hulinensis]MBW6437892.1 Uma2 family endonuclease [Actinoplanes hulinensis]